MEFPPEESSPNDENYSLRTEEEDILALTLVKGMNFVKKRGNDDYIEENEATVGKKHKVFKPKEFVSSFEGDFGSFSMGYATKKEAAGKILPPPSQ